MESIYAALNSLQMRKKSTAAKKYIPPRYLTGQVRVAFIGKSNYVTINQVALVSPVRHMYVAVFTPDDYVKIFHYSAQELQDRKNTTLTNQHGGSDFNSNTYIMKLDYTSDCNLVETIPLHKQKLNGQYNTTNATKILEGFEQLVEGKQVVDFTAGKGDLLKWARDNGAKSVLGYDIDPSVNPSNIELDTLDTPVSLPSHFVMSNPPFLRKCGTKTVVHDHIYKRYGVDNLYKAHIMSLTCKEGIMIVPANFLSEAKSKARDWFFRRYSITKARLFTYKVFDDADLSVVAFHYKKNKALADYCTYGIDIYYPNNQVITKQVTVSAAHKWLVGGETLSQLQVYANGLQVEIKSCAEQTNTNIYLQNINGGTLSFGASYHSSRPSESTNKLVSNRVELPGFTVLTKTKQLEIVAKFNKLQQDLFDKYDQLPFSNYVEAGKLITSGSINKTLLAASAGLVLVDQNPATALFDWGT